MLLSPNHMSARPGLFPQILFEKEGVLLKGFVPLLQSSRE